MKWCKSDQPGHWAIMMRLEDRGRDWMLIWGWGAVE